MGIIVANLLDFREQGGDASFFDTNSYSPAANQTVLLICNGVGQVSPPPIIPTIVGNGLSWSLVASLIYFFGGVDRGRLTVFRGLSATPTVGTTRVSYAATKFQQALTVIQFSNTDIGNLGANAIVGIPPTVEIASGSGLNPSIGAPAGEDLENSQIGILGNSDPSIGVVPGIGFSTIVNNPTTEGGGHYIQMSQVVRTLVDFNPTNDPTFAIIAIELRNATPAGAAAGPQIQGRPSFVAGNLITP